VALTRDLERALPIRSLSIKAKLRTPVGRSTFHQPCTLQAWPGCALGGVEAQLAAWIDVQPSPRRVTGAVYPPNLFRVAACLASGN